MQTTQLACPHCGSMLSLGGVIAPGTPVACLICSQSFAAASMAVAAPPPAIPNAPKPQAGILVSKPHATVKPALASAPRPMPNAADQPTPSGGGKASLWAITLGLLVLLMTGAGFAIWKLNAAGSAHPVDPSIAVNQPPDGSDKTSAIPTKGSDSAAEKIAPPGDDVIGDDARQIREAQKNKLQRKPSANGGVPGPEFDPVTAIEIPAPTVPGLEPARINAAIDKGVAYLKRTQAANGAWNGAGFTVGATALGGLTLLECKAPPNDLHVQRAAFFVRSNTGSLNMTYEVSLAILFLDRLGEARDRPVIQGLALRLLAGQTEGGGWSYDCPLLSATEMYQLYTFLRSYKIVDGVPAKKKGPPSSSVGKKTNTGTNPFNEFGEMVAEKEPASEPKDPAPAEKKGAKQSPLRPEMLAPRLRNLPVVRNAAKTKASLQLRITPASGDNSNTQFAVLALWTARRHDISCDAALLTSFQRFATSQYGGSWPYQPVGYQTECTATMIPAGLLGLAMGHGVAPDVGNANPGNPKAEVVKPALQDPKISAALKALAANIGDVAPNQDEVGPFANMYLLWSIERVAMLYDLKTIEGKDWYGWGAQKLLKHQSAQGDWPSAYYPGQCPHVNSCFALLFLKRSNLVQDLTVHLRMTTTIGDAQR